MPEETTVETLQPEEFFQNAFSKEASGKPLVKVTPEEEVKPKVEPTKVTKKAPDESVRQLAQQRDNLQKELDKREARIAELEALKELEPLKKVNDYIKNKYNADKVDEVVVDKYIEHNKSRKQREAELADGLKKKDAIVEDIQITLSDRYRKDFQEPWTRAEHDFTAILCPVDDEGKPKNLGAILELQKRLLTLDKDGNPPNALQCKGIMQKFSSEYEKATGEPFIIPEITKVTNGIATIKTKAEAAHQARKNWQNSKVEQEKKAAYEQSEATKFRVKQEIDGRNFKTNKLITDFDYNSVDGIFDKQTVEKKFKDQNDKFIKMYKGEEPAMPYEKIIELSFKADAYDELLTKYKEQEKALNKEKNKRGSGLPSGSSERTPKVVPKVGEHEEDDEKESVESFFGKAKSRM